MRDHARGDVRGYARRDVCRYVCGYVRGKLDFAEATPFTDGVFRLIYERDRGN